MRELEPACPFVPRRVARAVLTAAILTAVACGSDRGDSPRREAPTPPGALADAPAVTPVAGDGAPAVTPAAGAEAPAVTSVAGDGPSATPYLPAPAVAPSDASLGAPLLDHGVDVSRHVGQVDWPALRAQGFTFAFAKATEGVDLLDAAFADHWPAMKAAGLVRGAYHFYVTEDDPEAQAQFFLDNVALEPGDFAPVVDIETIGRGTQPGLAGRLRTFLDILERQLGVKPIIYTSPNFWDQQVGAGFGDHPLWIAEYGVAAPKLPAGWDDWHLWQWQGDAELDGVERRADLNRANGSSVDLRSLLIAPVGE